MSFYNYKLLERKNPIFFFKGLSRGISLGKSIKGEKNG